MGEQHVGFDFLREFLSLFQFSQLLLVFLDPFAEHGHYPVRFQRDFALDEFVVEHDRGPTMPGRVVLKRETVKSIRDFFPQEGISNLILVA